MAMQRSFFSRAYAPAWGILLGTAVGAPIDLVIHSSGSVTGGVAVLGLVIGTVIYYEDESDGNNESANRPAPHPERKTPR